MIRETLERRLFFARGKFFGKLPKFFSAAKEEVSFGKKFSREEIYGSIQNHLTRGQLKGYNYIVN